MSAVDLGIILLFLGYSLYAGLSARRVSSQNLDEYFLAGRSLPGWKAGISMAATQFAADTPLLVTGLVATAGIFSLWRLWIYGLAFLFMGYVLGPAWRRAGVLTDAELSEFRYGGRLAVVLRAAKAVYFGTIFNCTVPAMVLLAATRIAEPFLTWNLWLPPGVFEPVVSLVEWSGVSLVSGPETADWAVRSAGNLLSLGAVVGVTTLYSTTGGLRAVVNTDVVQFTVAMVATTIYALVVVDRAGGWSGLPDRLAVTLGPDPAQQLLAFTPDQAAPVGWAVLGTIAIQWIAQMNADGTGYLAQRTMACRSDRDARNAAVVFVFAQVLLRSLLWVAIALALLLLFPLGPELGGEPLVAAREGTFVTGIVRYLPVGARGLMLTGMLAALASTLDTHLNWGASYWTNDIYRRLVCQAWRKREPSGRALVNVARLSNLLILVLALVVLTQLDSIQSAWKASLLLGAGMGVPLVLRWTWWRVTAVGELGAIVISTALAPLLLYGFEEEGARLILMALASTATVVLAACLSPSTPNAAQLAFYRRVHPPGFWGPVARACGDDPGRGPSRLARGLQEAARLACGVYCLLVGGGTLLFGSPAPSFFPWRLPWAFGLLALGGLALAWRRLRPLSPALN